MFHELYVLGPPWRASFWTSVPQRRIAEPRLELGHPRLQNRTMLGERLHLRPEQLDKRGLLPMQKLIQIGKESIALE